MDWFSLEKTTYIKKYNIMDFIINKNSTLPRLKMELIQDGINSYNNFFELIQNANIYFSMADVNTGIKRISRRKAGLTQKTTYVGCNQEEFYLTYQFTKKDTSKAGTYFAQFIIEFLDGSGTLIVPIHEALYVHVLEEVIKK